jgi:uncharacterized protein YjcR
MARARSPARDKAFDLYKGSNGKKLLKDIAFELGVSDSQIRKWKNQDRWDEQMNGNVTIEKGNVTNQKASPVRAPKGNQYAKGNKGNSNPKKKFTERNTAAVKHGLFSRYMPKETLEIMDMIAGSDPADLIWMQIELQFAAIIRAQQIMFVEDKDDMAKGKSQEGWGESGSDKYDIQFAWDRHATFMNAQTKAISELRASIKQFMELADSQDERRYKLELMQQQIEKMKREGNPDTSTEDKLKDYFTALGGAFRDK